MRAQQNDVDQTPRRRPGRPAGVEHDKVTRNVYVSKYRAETGEKKAREVGLNLSVLVDSLLERFIKGDVPSDWLRPAPPVQPSR
ncbi:hypothetical protein ACGFXC_10530 [Streptomyces sp. NPDC048507]|uniref:hypothetical protein n=1 Tax=Streptomyces sp. NPDC048507 TaxID=3365560 RepID=UPI003722DEAA